MNLDEFKEKWESQQKHFYHTVITNRNMRYWVSAYKVEDDGMIRFTRSYFARGVRETVEVATLHPGEISKLLAGRNGYLYRMNDGFVIVSKEEYLEIKQRQKELEQKVREQDETLAFMQLKEMREPY
ncbi:MAG: hypothetical protein JRN26_05495 [Nitrososphaerota archaeon]|jgi:hypothetical protein|nr:hypothetical protein [Nitrososphaerota archaeon]MDG6927179.1 hypothetical protein [Nitrososphaerota archaeon]MDG6930833.1 hypothetical protein [Nitrososphaerota archaeon]MDG6932277.1 hypothetical protein [Nitrososphaerota archaeon]MDG6936318.1 hypothetical protein [Nitrososphaerota archaeon]